MSKPAAIVAALAAMIACGSALCAPHLVPCRRTPGYEDAVERVMRAAWPHELGLLAIMYVPVTEHGVGLARTEEGFDLGVALLEAFGRRAADARVEVKAATDPIVVDGYKFEILLAGRSCVALENPPRDSDAYKIDRLVRALYDRVPTWSPSEREAFEANLLAAVPY